MKKKFILGNTAITAVLTAFLTLGNCPAVDPLDCTVLFPSPYDCGDFYSCSNGVPILMHCPDGLHFNACLDVCDWPSNAGCMDGGGGRNGSFCGGCGDLVILKVWYDNVYVWSDPFSTSTTLNLFAPTSDKDPNKIGECNPLYRKHARQQTHSCYVTNK